MYVYASVLCCLAAVLISCHSLVTAKLVETEGRLRKELESEAGAHAEASKEVSRLSAELETCKQAKEELAAEKGEGSPHLCSVCVHVYICVKYVCSFKCQVGFGVSGG